MRVILVRSQELRHTQKKKNNEYFLFLSKQPPSSCNPPIDHGRSHNHLRLYHRPWSSFSPPTVFGHLHHCLRPQHKLPFKFVNYSDSSSLATTTVLASTTTTFWNTQILCRKTDLSGHARTQWEKVLEQGCFTSHLLSFDNNKVLKIINWIC